MKRSAGQATIEYVGAVALVATVLALAGGVVDARAIPHGLVHSVRVAICIAGGDVCRGSDATRAGLAPCVRHERSGRQVWKGSFFVAGGDGRAYAIEQRSDGRVAVSAIKAREIGLRIPGSRRRSGPLDLAAEGMLGITDRWTWILPDAAAAQAFLRRLPNPHVIETDGDWRHRRLPPPTERYHEGGVALELTAGASKGVSVPLLEVGGREAIGRARGPDGTTWIFDAGSAGGRAFGGILPAVELRRAGPWTLAVTERGGRVTRMVVSTRVPGRDGTEVEVRGHLDPSANPAIARDMLALRDGISPADALRAHRIARHIREYATIEREVHRVTSRRWGLNAAAELRGVGIEREGRRVERTLVSAEVLHPGGRRSARRDCTGL